MTPGLSGSPRVAEAVIDLAAVRDNVRSLAAAAGSRALLVDMSGDAHGHGAAQVAEAALAAGAAALGTSRVGDAIALRSTVHAVPIVAWQHTRDTDFVAAAAASITVVVRSSEQLSAAIDAGVASLQLGVDAAGFAAFGPDAFVDACRSVASLQSAGRLGPVGLMLGDGGAASACATARELGVELDAVHAVAASTGPTDDDVTMLRVGAEVLGLDETRGHRATDVGLRPAMTVRAPVLAIKSALRGTGVSYGYIYYTTDDTRLALLSIGYGDGIDRAAGNVAPIRVGGVTGRIAGRVAMDSCVVDIGDRVVAVGDWAVLFGDPAAGDPSAEEWADALGTSSAVVASRMTARVVRKYR
ncbi:alanine racemase [Marisediminicola senii]|uniref:alanine racemase n=1 Tax=Marisediminicola senii TaxID=2711233 RepID=UPI0013EDBD97|nr:alanine racemase C-terminal domain-containing protein [Marisediminicola senii]